jgi:flagellin
LVQFGRNTTAIDIKLDTFAIPEVALGFHTTGDSIMTEVDKDGAGTNTVAYGATEAAAAISGLAVGDEVFFANLTAGAQAARTAGAVALAGSDISAGSAEAALSLLDLKTLVDNLRIDAGDLYNKVSNTMAHMSALNTGYQLDVQSKMDVDFAGETTELAKGQILAQAGTAMLAQANAQGQGMLALLQS